MMYKNKSIRILYFATKIFPLLAILFLLFIFSAKSVMASTQISGAYNVTSRYSTLTSTYFHDYDNLSSGACPALDPAVHGWVSINGFTSDTVSLAAGSTSPIPMKIDLGYLVCHLHAQYGYIYPGIVTSSNDNVAPAYQSGFTKTGLLIMQGKPTITPITAGAPTLKGTISGVGTNTRLTVDMTSDNWNKYQMAYQDFTYTPTSTDFVNTTSKPITYTYQLDYYYVAVNYFGYSGTNGYCVQNPWDSAQSIVLTSPWPSTFTTNTINPGTYKCDVHQSSATIKITVQPSPTSCTQTNTCPVATSCPGFPNYSSIVAPMPYTGPNYTQAQSYTTTQSATSPYPGLYYQYTPQGVKETSLQDASIGGTSVLPTKVSESDGSPQTASTASGSITLNYLPYVLAYPYDFNQPQVNYNNIYQQTIWTPTYVSTYCSTVGSLSGTSCSYGATYNNGYYYCPYPYTTDPVTGSCSGPQAYQPPWYSCPYGGSLSGTTCTYTATTEYSWSAGPTQTIKQPTSTLGQQMTPCYGRIFTLQPISGASASLELNGAVNYEYPNTANLLMPLQYYFDIPPGDPTPGDGFRQDTQLSGVNVNGPSDKYHQFASMSTSYLGNICNPSQTLPNFIGPGIGNSNQQNASLSCSITTDDDNTSDFVAGDYAVFNGSINYQTGSLTETSAYGTFSVTSSTSTTYGPYQTQNVYTKPYINVNGGDVMAGFGQTNNACSASNIYTWNQGSGLYYGSGSTLAVITGGLDSGFASGQGTSNTPPNGLIFSNNVAGSSYGGKFCSYPTTATVASSQTQQLYSQLDSVYGSGNSCNLSSTITTPCLYNYGSSSFTMPSSLSIGPGGHVIFYGTGDFNIGSDFSISIPSGVSDNPNYIPSLEVVVGGGGNINIANNVTQIAGVYMATGNINDCVIGGILPSPTGNMFNDIRQPSSNTCGNQLVVNGVLEANQIKFDRTYDSLYESTPSLSDASGTTVSGGYWTYTPPTCRWYWLGYYYGRRYFCWGGGYVYHSYSYSINDTGHSSYTSTNSDAAEVFNYSPLSWLTPNNFQGLYQNQSTPVIQSVTSLSPIITP